MSLPLFLQQVIYNLVWVLRRKKKEKSEASTESKSITDLKTKKHSRYFTRKIKKTVERIFDLQTLRRFGHNVVQYVLLFCIIVLVFKILDIQFPWGLPHFSLPSVSSLSWMRETGPTYTNIGYDFDPRWYQGNLSWSELRQIIRVRNKSKIWSDDLGVSAFLYLSYHCFFLILVC